MTIYPCSSTPFFDLPSPLPKNSRGEESWSFVENLEFFSGHHLYMTGHLCRRPLLPCASLFCTALCSSRKNILSGSLLPELSAKNFDISGSSKCLSTKRTFFPHQDFSILSFEYLVDCRSGMQGKLESVSEIFFQSSLAIPFFVGFWLSKWFCFCWTFWWPSRFPGIISWRCSSNFKTSSVHVVAVTLHLYERLFPHFRCVVLSFFTLLISTLLRVTNGFHCCVLRS